MPRSEARRFFHGETSSHVPYIIKKRGFSSRIKEIKKENVFHVLVGQGRGYISWIIREKVMCWLLPEKKTTTNIYIGGNWELGDIARVAKKSWFWELEPRTICSRLGHEIHQTPTCALILLKLISRRVSLRFSFRKLQFLTHTILQVSTPHHTTFALIFCAEKRLPMKVSCLLAKRYIMELEASSFQIHDSDSSTILHTLPRIFIYKWCFDERFSFAVGSCSAGCRIRLMANKGTAENQTQCFQLLVSVLPTLLSNGSVLARELFLSDPSSNPSYIFASAFRLILRNVVNSVHA